jgi:hypothetical protein
LYLSIITTYYRGTYYYLVVCGVKLLNYLPTRIPYHQALGQEGRKIRTLAIMSSVAEHNALSGVAIRTHSMGIGGSPNRQTVFSLGYLTDRYHQTNSAMIDDETSPGDLGLWGGRYGASFVLQVQGAMIYPCPTLAVPSDRVI